MTRPAPPNARSRNVQARRDVEDDMAAAYGAEQRRRFPGRIFCWARITSPRWLRRISRAPNHRRGSRENSHDKSSPQAKNAKPVTMKVCVIGAGAIGGLLAAKLARAGEDVSVVARGAHLAAIASSGLTLIEEGAQTVAKVKASDRIADFGEQDLIILGMKAHQVAAVIGDLPAIMGPRTAVLTAQNGIPWWYFFKHGGPHEGARLESVDPGGVIADHLPIDRVLASVVYPAAEIERPGVIRHIEGNRFSLAEIDGSKSERILRVSEAFTRAGFQGPGGRRRARRNLDETLGQSELQPDQRANARDARGHLRIRADARARRQYDAGGASDRRGARRAVQNFARTAHRRRRVVGAHKTSMLQDIEAGRAIEADALLGSVIELGVLVGVGDAAPRCDLRGG